VAPIIISPYSVLVPPGGFPPNGSFSGAPGTAGQLVYSGNASLTDQQAALLRQGQLRVSAGTVRYPLGEIGGQLVPEDTNHDGIPDYVSSCIASAVPCAAGWPTHAAYVSAVEKLASQLAAADEISFRQYIQIVRTAQQSNCGASH
jgi:hypothetical protein